VVLCLRQQNDVRDDLVTAEVHLATNVAESGLQRAAPTVLVSLAFPSAIVRHRYGSFKRG